MHIILLILKIIGILLLILLGLVLFLVLSVLYMPICYSGSGAKEGENFQCSGTVSWFLHLIAVSAKMESGKEEPEIQIRILGISLESYQKFFGKFKKKEESEKKQLPQEPEKLPEPEGLPELEEPSEPEDLKVSEELSEPEKKQLPERTERTRKKKQKKKEKKKKPKKEKGNFKHKVEAAKSKLRKIKDRWEHYKRILKSENFRKVKSLATREALLLWKRIRPKKLTGEVSFGFENPAMTGQVLGAVAMFYALYGKHLSLKPCFDRQVLDGWIRLSGRIYGFIFVRIFWIYFTNKEIKKFKKIIKQ